MNESKKIATSHEAQSPGWLRKTASLMRRTMYYVSGDARSGDLGGAETSQLGQATGV